MNLEIERPIKFLLSVIRMTYPDNFDTVTSQMGFNKRESNLQMCSEIS